MSELVSVNPAVNSDCQQAVTDSASHKTRKTRRGKKRKGRFDDDSGEAFTKSGDCNTSHENNSPQKVNNLPPKRKKAQVLIRPVDVPKAPENFTQFIIDDHENCHLYQSFESPHRQPRIEERDMETHEEVDLPEDTVPLSSFCEDDDYYECLDYTNMVDFYEKDFEAVYSKARIEQLILLPHGDLVSMYELLEQQSSELQEQMEQCDPHNLLNDLQQQLLDLQEENRALRQLNKKLRNAADGISSCSSNDEAADISSELENNLPSPMITDSAVESCG